MSFDHKPESTIERTRIEKAGGHVSREGRVNNGLNLSRALGNFIFYFLRTYNRKVLMRIFVFF